MRSRTILTIVLSTLFILLLSACSSGAEGKTSEDVDKQQQQYILNGQRIPFHTYSYAIALKDQIDHFSIDVLVPTWTVWVGDGTGEPIDMCTSKSYPLPYSTQRTNPWQIPWIYGGYRDAAIAQADPNGLFPPASADATWVVCVEDDGSLHPTYVEPKVLAYDHPIRIVFDAQRGMYRIQRAGAASEDTKLDLPETAPVTRDLTGK